MWNHKPYFPNLQSLQQGFASFLTILLNIPNNIYFSGLENKKSLKNALLFFKIFSMKTSTLLHAFLMYGNKKKSFGGLLELYTDDAPNQWFLVLIAVVNFSKFQNFGPVNSTNFGVNFGVNFLQNTIIFKFAEKTFWKSD